MSEMRWWRVERERKDDLHVCCAADLAKEHETAKLEGIPTFLGTGYLDGDGSKVPHPFSLDWITVVGVFGEDAPPRPRGPVRE